MPFQSGNKLGEKRKARRGGAPTKEQKAAKASFLAELERLRDERGSKLAKLYYDMAEADPATMRHAVDKVMPNAKQAIEIEADGLFEAAVRRAKELRKKE